jgi:hypothetical protein
MPDVILDALLKLRKVLTEMPVEAAAGPHGAPSPENPNKTNGSESGSGPHGAPTSGDSEEHGE